MRTLDWVLQAMHYGVRVVIWLDCGKWVRFIMTGGHPSATGHSNAGTSAASSVYGSKNTNYDLIEDYCEVHVMRLSRCPENSSKDQTVEQLGRRGLWEMVAGKKKLRTLQDHQRVGEVCCNLAGSSSNSENLEVCGHHSYPAPEY